VPRTKTIPEEADIRAITARADAQMRALLLLMSDAGCRLGEALAYRPNPDPAHPLATLPDRTLEHLDIWSTKTRTHRSVPIPTRLKAALIALPDQPFTGLYPRYVQRRLDELAAAARRPKTSPHRWRHSYASRMAAQGVPLHTIQTLLGHRNLTTTTIYIHTGPDQWSLAAAALDRAAGARATPITSAAQRSLQLQIDNLSRHLTRLTQDLAIVRNKATASGASAPRAARPLPPSAGRKRQGGPARREPNNAPRHPKRHPLRHRLGESQQASPSEPGRSSRTPRGPRMLRNRGRHR